MWHISVSCCKIKLNIMLMMNWNLITRQSVILSSVAGLFVVWLEGFSGGWIRERICGRKDEESFCFSQSQSIFFLAQPTFMLLDILLLLLLLMMLLLLLVLIKR